MHRLPLFSFFFCALLLYACKSYTPDTFPDTGLRFGNGGGFTGMTTEYLLLPNGQLFRRTGRAGGGDWQEIGKTSRKAVRTLYRSWESNAAFRRDIRQPGNRYYFINMTKDTVSYRQSWGASGYQPDESLRSFYDNAMQLVRSVTDEDEPGQPDR